MNKKLLAILLTVAMALGTTLTAFAADPKSVSFNGSEAAGEGQTIEHEGTVQPVTISVTISALSGNIIANPYGLEVDGKTDSLIGDEITVSNNSQMKIALGIKGVIDLTDSTLVTSGTGANCTILTAAPAANVTTLPQKKTLYVQAVVKDKDKAKSMVTNANATAPITLVYGTTAKDIQTKPVLAAGTGTAPASDGTGECVVVISGATQFPASDKWVASDTFKVKTTFDIGGTIEKVTGETGAKAVYKALQ
jgi:hypothetical protein